MMKRSQLRKSHEERAKATVRRWELCNKPSDLHADARQTLESLIVLAILNVVVADRRTRRDVRAGR